MDVKLVSRIAYLQFMKGLSLPVNESLLSAREINGYRNVLEGVGEIAAAQHLLKDVLYQNAAWST